MQKLIGKKTNHTAAYIAWVSLPPIWLIGSMQTKKRSRVEAFGLEREREPDEAKRARTEEPEQAASLSPRESKRSQKSPKRGGRRSLSSQHPWRWRCTELCEREPNVDPAYGEDASRVGEDDAGRFWLDETLCYQDCDADPEARQVWQPTAPSIEQAAESCEAWLGGQGVCPFLEAQHEPYLRQLPLDDQLALLPQFEVPRSRDDTTTRLRNFLVLAFRNLLTVAERGRIQAQLLGYAKAHARDVDTRRFTVRTSASSPAELDRLFADHVPVAVRMVLDQLRKRPGRRFVS